MKSYPSIIKEPRHSIYLYCFDKLDGSNIRAEWSSKKGFYKFGSRTQLIDESSGILGKSISIIKSKYEKDLSDIFKKERFENTVCFFEFYGQNSFAGQHKEAEEQTCTLFDVNIFKKGLLEPKDFIKTFGHLDIPKVLYEGHYSQELYNSVKQSTLLGMTFEGVVCKGANDKKTKMPIMFKIKSNAWLNKLKDFCKGDEKMFSLLE